MVVTARYYRVSPRYWHLSRDWEDRLRLLGLYVQTCEHRTTEGIYRLPTAYIIGDLGWPARTVDTKLADLVTTGFIKHDARNEVVLVNDALEIQPPATKDQITGALKRLRSVPATPLLFDFYQLANVHAGGLFSRALVELECHYQWHSGGHSNGRTSVTSVPVEFS